MLSKVIKLKVFGFGVLCLIALAFSFIPISSKAGASHNLRGFAWSSNIGWISFNSLDDQDPVTAGIQSSAFDYGVNRDVGNTLTGYAWSSNVGWIQFGGLSGFPSGGGTTAVNAQVSGSNLIGWARAITPNVSGVSGWDGWISLAGTNYGVTISGTTYSGYAWGGDVVGWISFDAAGANGVSSNGSNSLGAELPLGTSIAATTIPYNSNPYLVWTINPPGSDTCQIAKTLGPTLFTTLTGLTTSGNAQTGSLGTGAYTFQITCSSLPTQTISFNIDTQAPGFTFGGTEALRVQFPTTASSDSETKTIMPNAFGGFTGTITMSIQSSPALPNGATILYSFDDGATFTANPTTNIAYNGSDTFKVRVSKPITGTYSIVLLGTSGANTATKTYTLTPSTFNPTFDEF